AYRDVGRRAVAAGLRRVLRGLRRPAGGLADSWDESIDRMLKDEVVAEGADWLDDSADAQQVLRSAARKLLADLVSETAAEILWVCS
ncbi:unnamed protein product, partial [Prorocentrum cordatum]